MAHKSDIELTDAELAVRQKHRGWIIWVGIVVGLLFAVMIGYTSVNSYTIVNSHNAELSETLVVAKQIAAFQHKATGNHGETLHYLEAICASTPGCPEKVQALEGG